MRHLLKTNRAKFVAKSTRTLTSLLGYLVVFMVIYGAINWYRRPIMPADFARDLPVIAPKDTPVLVYFWGSWCHICRTTTPKVNELAKTHPVITVAVASGDKMQVADYMRTHGYGFRVINDPDGALFAKWGGQVTPSYVIIKNGEFEQGFVGLTPLWLLKVRMGWAKV